MGGTLVDGKGFGLVAIHGQQAQAVSASPPGAEAGDCPHCLLVPSQISEPIGEHQVSREAELEGWICRGGVEPHLDALDAGTTFVVAPASWVIPVVFHQPQAPV